MKLLKVAACLAVVMMLSQDAFAGIALTPHDLSSGNTTPAAIHANGGSANTDRICVFCHTPHGATTGLAVPLWNKGAVASTGTYTMYVGADGAMATDPGATSLACLACHDGTTTAISVMNNLNAAPVTAADIAFDDPAPAGLDANDFLVNGLAALDTNLTNDHPVGVTYGADTDMEAEATVNATLPLFSSKVECATCHTAHDNSNTFFLRETNAGSALCTFCHIDK